MIANNYFDLKVLSFSEIIELEKLKYNYKLFKKYFPESFISFQEDEFIRFMQGSASVEGNTITLKEATIIVKNNLSIEGKTIDEIREIENLKNTNEIIRKDPKLNIKNIKKIHKKVMLGFDSKKPGEFRDGPIYITGSRTKPPKASEIKKKIEYLILWYNKNKKKIHPIELSSYIHSKFEEIHPFRDGNGRTGREILNLILLKNNYPRVIINLKNRNSYINILETGQYLNKEFEFSKFIYNSLLQRNKEIQTNINNHKEVIYKKIK
jgi:Fic family protein